MKNGGGTRSLGGHKYKEKLVCGLFSGYEFILETVTNKRERWSSWDWMKEVQKIEGTGIHILY